MARRLRGARLPVRWERLTTHEFPRAVRLSKGVCLLPLGSIEPHGPHLPMIADSAIAHRLACAAAERESAVVFPPFWFGGNLAAAHQSGAVAVPLELAHELLLAVCREIARNGLAKILLVNAHGGNHDLLGFTLQAALGRDERFCLYLHAMDPDRRDALYREIFTRPFPGHGHACECETSLLLATAPELVDRGKIPARPGDPTRALARLSGYVHAGSAVDWMAKFPRHYGGDALPASAEKGRRFLEARVAHLAEAIRRVKADRVVPQLCRHFREAVAAPERFLLAPRGRKKNS